jgi:gamma-glutamylcyclotransferase (GGCT)/AIG2-like uncharacterized protein YtfP
MKKGDLLFVYGTLRQGESADLSLRSGAEFVADDVINGNLYEVSWFPGVKLLSTNDYDPSRPVVFGSVFRLNDEGLIRHLDAYEGYPNLYDRQQVETGGSRFVWVYTYRNSVGENQRIASGDWLNQIIQAA